jgi:hypothetical protein
MYEVYQEDHVQRWLDGDLGVLDEYQATVDWPGCSFWRELTELHPDAKVILSTRDAELWWQSFNSTVAGVIHRAHKRLDDPRPWVAELHRFVVEVVEAKSFGVLAHLAPVEQIAAYIDHQRAVIATIPAERLLIHDVADGWGPLCSFLEVPAPAVPFPRANDRAEFQRLHNGHARSKSELAASFAQVSSRGGPSGGTYSNE